MDKGNNAVIDTGAKGIDWARSTNFEAFSPEDLGHVVPRTILEHSLAAGGHFRGSLLHAMLGRYGFVNGKYNLPLLCNGPMPLSLGIVMEANGSSRTNGLELGLGDIATFGQGTDFNYSLAPGTNFVLMQIDQDDLDSLGISFKDHCFRIYRQNRTDSRRTIALAKDTIGAIRQCELGTDNTHPSAITSHVIGDNLLGILAGALSHDDNKHAPKCPALKSAWRSKLVSRADAYIRENVQDRILLTDLCKHLNTTLRQLELAFQQVYGMSPKRYEMILRLNMFRFRLLNASPGAESVTEIALQCGFFHLGRLPNNYRKIFGELPSETLAVQSVGRRGTDKF